MLQRVVGTVLAVLTITCVLGVESAAAANQNIVISSVQLGTAAAATHEFIELYNNSSVDTDVTNWCAYYAASTSSANGSKMACFSADSSSIHLFLPAKSQAFFASSALRSASPALGSDLIFSATLSGAAGHVRIIDASGEVVDKIGWGLTALSPETSPATTAPNGQILVRKVLVGSIDTLQDTDNNALDFGLAVSPAVHVYGSVYELQDICTNIEGIQQVVPDTFTSDGFGVCVPPPVDVCSNIDGMQTTLPSGFVLDPIGDCIDTDLCHNLDDVQLLVPAYYVSDDERYCSVVLPMIIINELLPNPDGDDEGNEFIELYNPNDEDVALDLYMLIVGITTPKAYHFPAGAVVPARAYVHFSDDDINFTLVNSSSAVSLVDPDGQIISSADYVDPPAGFSWSLIDTLWQYTNAPTPALINQNSTVDPEVEEEVVGAKPCAANQFRSPDTNRCRLLITAGSTLAACKDNQYRSEETNRCRTIASTTTALAPCGTNQERNPDTNRCRTVVTSVPDVPFAVEPIVQTGQATLGWWALGGVGILALAYAGWEWRVEITRASRRAIGFLTRAK